MDIKFFQSKANGIICAPKSKSEAHRALICAALSGSESRIKGIEKSDDIDATLTAIKTLGASITRSADALIIKGISPEKINSDIIIDCNESASTLRFLIPIILLNGKKATFIGKRSLFARPLGIYESIFEKQGISYEKNESSLIIEGKLQSDEYEISGNISSQFISGLLFALPLCEYDSIIKIIPPIESRSYIMMTISMLQKFGISDIDFSDNIIFIKGNRKYKGTETEIGGDWSNSAFSDAFNYIGGKVTIKGLEENSLQGDKIYPELFAKLSEASPIISIADCPDLAPILFSLASIKNGAVFTDTARLKYKESGRAEAMATELKKFGTEITVYDNSVIINKADFHKPDSPLDSHNDHRIAMALSVLLSITGGDLIGGECINKSYPDFFDDIKSLGIKITEI